MKKLGLLSILLISFFISYAQPAAFTQTIKGVVIDDQSGNSLPNITVAIDNASWHLNTTTDEKGNFKLMNVPIGRQTIQFTAVGYEDAFASNIEVTSSNWFNPQMNYKYYMVPGILVILVTMVGSFLASLNIVKEKEIGTIEQINVSPVKKYQFILGKLIPFWCLGLIILSIGLIIARLAYGIIPAGSLFTIYIFAAVYLLSILGIGLLVSTYSSTQQQAMIQEATQSFQVMNPELLICTMDPSAKLDVELTIGKGRGYVPAEDNKVKEAPIGYVPIDSIFTPIKNVKYTIENTRVEQRTDFEKLIMAGIPFNIKNICRILSLFSKKQASVFLFLLIRYRR